MYKHHCREFKPLVGDRASRNMHQEACGPGGQRTGAALHVPGLCVPSVPTAGTAEASPTQYCRFKWISAESACTERMFAWRFVDLQQGALISPSLCFASLCLTTASRSLMLSRSFRRLYRVKNLLMFCRWRQGLALLGSPFAEKTPSPAKAGAPRSSVSKYQPALKEIQW